MHKTFVAADDLLKDSFQLAADVAALRATPEPGRFSANLIMNAAYRRLFYRPLLRATRRVSGRRTAPA